MEAKGKSVMESTKEVMDKVQEVIKKVEMQKGHINGVSSGDAKQDEPVSQIDGEQPAQNQANNIDDDSGIVEA